MGLTSLQLRAPTGVDAATNEFPRGATEFLQGANPDWLAHDGSQSAAAGRGEGRGGEER